MNIRKHLEKILVGTSGLLFAAAIAMPGGNRNGPVLNAAISVVSRSAPASHTLAAVTANDAVSSSVETAVESFNTVVKPLSHPRALEDAFRSYFAYKSEHPDQVKKPYLYFVDYGLPSTTPRGYVFNMDSLKIVDGPFTVAHGRGSSRGKIGTPTRFSNTFGSAATSLGLYLAQETYAFHGRAGGHNYGSIGLRLTGLSTGFNDNARARKVVAHGAPYVTSRGSGRSEGCPAMEQSRARRLLPKLANGAMVFLFAPDPTWMSKDPWVAGSISKIAQAAVGS